jgi:hypothetical protein
MQPVEFQGSRMIGKPKDMTDEECFAIPAASGVDDAGFPYWVTAWRPSYEDLQALQRGEPVWVKSTSHGLVPMLLYTLDENGNHNDAG